MPRPIRSPVRRTFAAVLLVVLAAALVNTPSFPAMLGVALAVVALPLVARAVWLRRARQETPGVPGA